jgi:hypothetical protein
MKGADCWTENWDIIGPEIALVMAGGEAVWHEDQLVPIARNGRLEDVYWTYSYSPAFDDSGAVGGVLVVARKRRSACSRRQNAIDSSHRSAARARKPKSHGWTPTPHARRWAVCSRRRP